MIAVYFIGGSRDLSKQVFDRMTLNREMLFFAPTKFGEQVISREHYRFVGEVPQFPSAISIHVYSFTHSETVELEAEKK